MSRFDSSHADVNGNEERFQLELKGKPLGEESREEVTLVAIGASVRKFRINRGLSQAELAGSDLDRTLVAHIEAGSCKASPEILSVIAHKLGVSILDLFEGMEANGQRSYMLESAEATLEIEKFIDAERLLDECETSIDSPEEQSRYHRLRGKLYLARNEFDVAFQEALEAVRIAETINHGECKARAYALCAEIHHRRGRAAGALAFALQAAATADEVPVEPGLRAQMHANCAIAYAALCDMANATEEYRKAFAIAQADENLREIGWAEVGLSMLAGQQGDIAAAISHAEHAIQLAERFSITTLHSLALHNLGQALADDGQYDTALHCQKEALRIAEELNDSALQASIFEQLADLSLRWQQFSKALYWAEKAIALTSAMGDDARHAITLAIVADVYDQQGDYETASTIFEQAHSLASEPKTWAEISPTFALKEVLLRRGDVAMRHGYSEAAAADFRHAAKLSQLPVRHSKNSD